MNPQTPQRLIEDIDKGLDPRARGAGADHGHLHQPQQADELDVVEPHEKMWMDGKYGKMVENVYAGKCGLK